MPIYKYRCEKCKLTQERISKLGDTNKICKCGHVAVKIFSANSASFIVNGAGAYNAGVFKSK